ncbi:MAG: choice-of-anchor I domain-containing protein, partial [Chitinophagaceae bacterium]
MMKKISYSILGLLFFAACTKQDLTEKDLSISQGNPLIKESVTFEAIGTIDLGSTGASEISAFDPLTNKLFVVKNDLTPGRIEVLDLSNPSIPAIIGNILISDYGSAVNSVSVNNGMLAAAIESNPKQNPGRIVVFRTTDYTVLANKEAGALPDMVTFSPDGKYIISANEGEPNDAYSIDPVGTVSIL